MAFAVILIRSLPIIYTRIVASSVLAREVFHRPRRWLILGLWRVPLPTSVTSRGATSFRPVDAKKGGASMMMV